MRYLLILLSIIIISLNSNYCQVEEDIEEYFKEGEYFFNSGDYEEAVYNYLKLVEHYADNANYNFKVGECYLKIPGKETNAISFFEKATTNITTKNKYKRKSFKETRAPLHAYYYLGNAYRINNQLDKALEAYDIFISSPHYFNNYNQVIVENELKSCERAKIIQDCPTVFDETLLDKSINTEAIEMNPVVSGDDKSLVFIRKMKFYDAIFYSVSTDNKWTEPVNINPQVISDGDLYPTSLSYDGNELYLVKRTNNKSDIYVSYLVDCIWTKAEKLNKNINSSFNETHACISEDGRLLYFTSDRPKGTGGLDIYISEKDKDNQWGKPKNLGNAINTKFDEDTPFVTNKGKRLFFSSQGHYNMGGFDIFYSEKDNGWMAPVNIGYPINNTGDNLFFTPVKGGEIAYLSKFNDKKTENKEIYRLEIYTNLPVLEISGIKSKCSPVKSTDD
ncbi:MAG: PD40 domain-containing protein [Bacteroidales bacterium]|nr:MAG: PD40 domain-containing protein [Bacteroidales bacterium]